MSRRRRRWQPRLRPKRTNSRRRTAAQRICENRCNRNTTGQADWNRTLRPRGAMSRRRRRWRRRQVRKVRGRSRPWRAAAELQKSLEQDVAAARRDVETQTALATKAAAEANQLKAADSGSADLRKSLQQERDRASRLEQDLATARQDVETQTALAAKASDEGPREKQAMER